MLRGVKTSFFRLIEDKIKEKVLYIRFGREKKRLIEGKKGVFCS